MRRVLLLLLALLTLVSASAQTLTTAIGSNPPTLDPQVTFNGFSFHVTNQVYETLVRVTPEGDIVPGLATAWSYPDPTTLRLTLREGVTFHDGTAFDADAVVASFQRILDPATAAPGRFVLSSIDEVRAVDATTVELVTDPPFAPLLAHLAHPVAAIVPVAQAADLARNPVGTGPYTFVRWVDGSEVVLQANANYWGGAPSITDVVVRIIPEVSTQVVELRSGGVDMIFNLPADNFLALAGDPALATGTLPGWGSAHLGFNVANPKLADLRVRQALAHAIDKALITEEFFRGLAAPGVAPIPGTVRYAADLVEPYPYDVEGAKALLKDADKENPELTIDIGNTDGPWHQAVAEAMRDQLAEAGIRLNVNVMPAAKYWEIWTETPFGGTAWTHRPLGTMVLSLAYRTGVAWNETRYSNPEFEKALDAAEATLDVEARKAKMETVEKIMQDDVPAILPIWRPVYTATKNKVHNYPPHPTLYHQFNKVWIES